MSPRSRLFLIGQPAPRRAAPRAEPPPTDPMDNLFTELQRECALRHGVGPRRGGGAGDPWGWSR